MNSNILKETCYKQEEKDSSFYNVILIVLRSSIVVKYENNFMFQIQLRIKKTTIKKFVTETWSYWEPRNGVQLVNGS